VPRLTPAVEHVQFQRATARALLPHLTAAPATITAAGPGTTEWTLQSRTIIPQS